MSELALRGRIVTPDDILEDAVVVIVDGTIQSVTTDVAAYPRATRVDGYIAPGFIDIHIHGIAGADTMDATFASIDKMATQLLKHGVTSFLPTTVTQSQDAISDSLRQVKAFMEKQASEGDGAEVIGVHLEGPWISLKAKGAQNGDFIVDPSEASISHVLDAATDILEIVTMAPELEGAHSAIARLREADIEVSIGHTTADYEQALHAIDLGARHVTHCFNAMTGLHHRDPGVVGAAFQEGVYAELIADGVHVHPTVMKALIQVKGRERIMLISDSIAAADMPDGNYALGGLPVVVKDGQCRLNNGTLAGSILTLDVAVRNIVNLCGFSLVDAIYMASTTPADSIGLGHVKGKIAPGYDADIVILDDELHVTQAYTAKNLRLG